MLLLVAKICTASAQAKVTYVNQNAPTNSIADGRTWETAFLQVQPAVDTSQAGDEVWVATGIYAQTVRLPEGIALYGGFSGTETNREQRNWQRNLTILEAGGPSIEPIVWCALAFSTNAARLDGFTLRREQVAGIIAEGVSVIIANNEITQRAGWNGGAGIICWRATVLITNNFIASHTGSPNSGGGEGIRGTISNLKIIDNRIMSNVTGISCRSVTTWVTSLQSTIVASRNVRSCRRKEADRATNHTPPRYLVGYEPATRRSARRNCAPFAVPERSSVLYNIVLHSRHAYQTGAGAV